MRYEIAEEFMSKRPVATRLYAVLSLGALLVLGPQAWGEQAAAQPSAAKAPREAAAQTPKPTQAPASQGQVVGSKTMVIPFATGVPETRPESPAQSKSAAEIPPDESALRARVKGYWDALLKRDYDALYAFTTPSYRKVFDKRHFLGNFGEQLRRDRAEVTKVTFNDAGHTSAHVLVAVLFTTEVAGKIAQLRGASEENWVKVDGEWYNVPDR